MEVPLPFAANADPLYVVFEAVHRLAPDAVSGVRHSPEGKRTDALVPLLRPDFAGVFQDSHAGDENFAMSPHCFDFVFRPATTVGRLVNKEVPVAPRSLPTIGSVAGSRSGYGRGTINRVW